MRSPSFARRVRITLLSLALMGQGSSAAEDLVVPSFQREVLPALTKFGCNQGGCHGKESGQNGFRLSLRGFAPEWDHKSITREVNGRRVDFASRKRVCSWKRHRGEWVMKEGPDSGRVRPPGKPS
jgi:hypothetical protein